MDSAQFTHLSLCTGYGGIDLGLRRVLPGLRTIAYAEIEEYACGLLAARMESGHLDPAPIWPNVKTFPFRDFHGRVDIISGGYPCQPFSAAGKRLGKDDPRHLWPWIADGIRLCQPRMCFFENVEGHISLGLRDVLGELAGLGYRATWGIFSAAEVGAPHQRKRVFILAHRDGAGLPGHRRSEWLGLSGRRPITEGCPAKSGGSGSARVLWPSRPSQPQFAWEPPRVVADAADIGRKRRCITGSTETSSATAGCGERVWPSRPSQPQFAWEPPRVVADRDRNQSRAERGDDGEVRCISEAQRESEHGATLSRGAGDAGASQVVADTKHIREDGGTGGLGRAQPQEESGESKLGDSAQAIGNKSARGGSKEVVGDAILYGHTTSPLAGGAGESQGEGWLQESAGGGSPVADASEQHRQWRSARTGRRSGSEIDATGGDAAEQRQAEPALGGDADGPAGGMDYAELSISCDNRTDELRLLGNGVVPATAELAFRTLLNRLTHE